MAKRLTEEKIEQLYKEYKTPGRVIKHCKAVGNVAYEIGKRLKLNGVNLDVELIKMSGFVHDLLRAEPEHDVAAGELLDELGYHEEADVVRHHMHYDFNSLDNLNEADIMCLADRLVCEDEYVGIDERIEYLIEKSGASKRVIDILYSKKKETKTFMRGLEAIIGTSIDGLFIHSNAEVEAKLSKILNKVEKPARYIGCENNMAVRNTSNKLRFAFAFPDLYEIGMSYMGMQILYNLLNKKRDIYCERVFSPALDMAEIMQEYDLPLFTLETKTPLKDMDVIGFTLQYEMSFTNVLEILNLASIKVLKSERSEEEPLIIAGGPCAYNPEPLSDFIDVFLIGDGEKLLPDFLANYKKSKEDGLTKREFLILAAQNSGVYVPEFYDVNYNDDNTVSYFEKLVKSVPDKIEKELISEIEEIEFPTEPIVPFIDTVHDRAVVEMFRGCTRGCRFCQAGMIYRPVRERKPETILEIALSQLQNTGHEELSLLSLSTSDYSDFEQLATVLMSNCAERNVSLSLPSLRLDSFSFSVLNEIQKYRKSGLTFAPEAGTQRLRDVINKGITEDDIFQAVEQAVTLGWTKIKLYFMIGLPTETYDDLDGIADIAKRVIAINKSFGKSNRFNVTVSVSNFVPKAHTPFQWAGQDSLELLRKKHDYLKGILKIKGVTFNYHDDFTSVLEAILARGDRRCGKLIYTAWQRGCIMDGWSEHFDEIKWRQAIRESDTNIDFYATRERNIDEVFPWSIIDSSVSERFLISEWERAKKEIITKDCREGCVGCGINARTKCSQGGIYE